jgi:hypothetical protein
MKIKFLAILAIQDVSCQQEGITNSITFNCSKPLASNASISGSSIEGTSSLEVSTALHSSYDLCPNELYWGKEILIVHFYYKYQENGNRRPSTSNFIISQGNLSRSSSIPILFSSSGQLWKSSDTVPGVDIVDFIVDPRLLNTSALQVTQSLNESQSAPFVIHLKMVIFDHLFTSTNLSNSSSIIPSSVNVNTIEVKSMVILPKNTNPQKPNATGDDALPRTIEEATNSATRLTSYNSFFIFFHLIFFVSSLL